MLPAAYGARRPTADLDALARWIADDQDTIVSLLSELAEVPLDDGVEFRTDTTTSRIVRVTLTPLMAGMEPVRVLGYPVETVLAENCDGHRPRTSQTRASATTPTSTRSPASTSLSTAQPAGRYWQPPRIKRLQFSRCPPRRRLRRPPAPNLRRGAAALGASRAVLWLEAPLARARRSVWLTGPAQGWLIPLSDFPASARTRRERFASLRDGLRPLAAIGKRQGIDKFVNKKLIQ
jgi:hypothetical protein